MIVKSHDKKKILTLLTELLTDIPQDTYYKVGRDIYTAKDGTSDIEYYLYGKEEVRNLDKEDN